MIIIADRRFVSSSFDNEEEIERVVISNAEFIFGPDSIMLPKSLIKSADGSGTIPDGFAIDFASRRWFVVEAELSAHPVWTHIAPQVSKQIVAAQQPASRKLLIEVVVNRVREDESLKNRIEELGIDEIDIRRVLTEIIESPPIIGIPIDHVSGDLREWAQTLKNEVKLWIVRKLVDLRNPAEILYEIPDEFRPVFDTTESASERDGNMFYDVSISDLIEAGLLKANSELSMSYKPRGGERQYFEATIDSNGDLTVEDRSFSAPSDAALHCIQKAGSDRNTVNGWTSWKTPEGRWLADVRTDYLKQQND
jgi:Restriction Enzyme Adenine Methylase Associated